MKIPEKWYVYCLKDPRTDRVRYVGWTSQTLAKRMTNHLSEALHESRQAHTFKARWIRTLLTAGIRPIIETLETGTGDSWVPAEQRWIAFFRDNGSSLTNGSDGGEGNLGYSPPPEVREKISHANKGCKRSPEHIAKMVAASRLANTGRHRSPEITEKIASQLRGIPRPPEVWENCRKASKARIVSAETRQKLSDYRRGKPLSLETRERMRESAKQKPPMSAETRALLSAKLKGRVCGTPEGRKRQIEKMRGRINPKAIAAMIAANTGSKHPPETAAKTAATRASWSPEYRAEVGKRIRLGIQKKRASNNGLLSLWER